MLQLVALYYCLGQLLTTHQAFQQIQLTMQNLKMQLVHQQPERGRVRGKHDVAGLRNVFAARPAKALVELVTGLPQERRTRPRLPGPM